MKKIIDFLQRNHVPLILLLVCFLSYGLLLPFVGFYLDDWYLIWFKHVFGPLDFVQYFSSDRPLMGYFYIAASFLLGGSESPLVWQAFGLITRWLCVAALWQMLNTLWPKARRQNTLVVLLAAVFPGFTQQWIAAIYSFFFACLAGFFFSITLMLKAIRSPGRFWRSYLPSLAIMAYVIPASEFYFGLEFVRLLILGLEFQKRDLKFFERIKKAGLLWLPYAVVLVLFSVWRIFFYESANHSLALKELVNGGIVELITRNLGFFYQAVVVATVNTWGNMFNLDNFPSRGITALAIWGLVGFVFLSLILWLRRAMRPTSEADDSAVDWRKQAPIIGLTSLVLAIIPFWSANLTVDVKFPDDRFLLAFLLGSCLIVVWFFEAVGFNTLKTAVVTALLVSVGMGYQIANANQYKNLWAMQTNALWQLKWRMPDLEPQTMVMAYQLPDSDYWSGHALTAYLNWMYGGPVTDREIDYYFLLLNSGQDSVIPEIAPEQPITSNFRSYTFNGNTSRTVFVYYTTDGCLRVLDPKFTPPEAVDETVALSGGNSHDPWVAETVAGAHLTDFRLIKDGSKKSPPVQIVGKEPSHGWCYAFEKAELAHQYGDYAAVISLYKEAGAQGLYPLNGTEYYPFIDSFARTGDWNTAEILTKDLLVVSNPALRSGLCHLWKTLAADFPGAQGTVEIISELECP